MCYRTGRYTVFEARLWFFQPGSFTGWGGEGVNVLCRATPAWRLGDDKLTGQADDEGAVRAETYWSSI